MLFYNKNMSETAVGLLSKIMPKGKTDEKMEQMS